MAVYISSFYPLCSTKSGRIAVKKFSLDPFIDGSCRREPDFMHDFPCITGLCRPNFVDKLKRDDIVIYTTNKSGVGKRLLISILQIDLLYPDHLSAAHWYRTKKLPLPNNLMVIGNLPFPLNQTHQRFGGDIKKALLRNPKHKANAPLIIRLWDYGYYKRSITQGKVVVCHYWNNTRNTTSPIEITESINNKIFHRLPGTQNPSILTVGEWKKFQDWLLNGKLP